MEERRTKLVKSVSRYLERGWQPIPVQPGSKTPRDKNWPDFRLSKNEISSYFQGGDNVGIILGEASGGLVDVDLDVTEAIDLAPEFLPPTNRRHGRAGARDSHSWYMAKPAPEPAKFFDCTSSKKPKQMLVELRSTGHQTVVPPSTHPSGERLFWAETGDPAQVDPAELRRCVADLAACTLVSRNWPEVGVRHWAAMALAGALLRNGWAEERVERFVTLAAKVAGDEEYRERKKDVATTALRIKEDRPATGIPTLAELLGEKVVQRLVDWLGLKDDAQATAPRFGHISYPEPLAPEAFHGVAGDFVHVIGPHTESDPAALLFQFLALFGNLIGRSPHFVAEADRRGPNLFVCLVGATAKGRKGSSWSHIKRAGAGVDREWEANRIQQGLSSGEGLIWAVRDPIHRRDPIKKGGKVVDYQDVIADHGVEDKRLLIVEPEFASVLRNLSRDTGAHISVIGHITRDELRRYLTSTEMGNGFANRFLWVCTRRSKCLPEGGQVDESEITALLERISDAATFARKIGKVERSEKARALWFQVYEELSEGKPGLLGAVTSRAEALVMRMALIYALLDRSTTIKRVHLKAALAIWRYAEQSARFIFGDSLGDPLADELLRALRKSAKGLTRTEIRDLFHHNRREADIERALSVLLEGGHVDRQIEGTGEPGRPSERWLAVRTTITTKYHELK